MRVAHGVVAPGLIVRFISRSSSILATALLALFAIGAQAVPTLSGAYWQSAYVGWPTNGTYTVNWTGGDVNVMLEAQTAPYTQSAATNKVTYSVAAGARSLTISGKSPGIYYYTGFIGLCPNCAVTNDIAVVVYNSVPVITAWPTAYAGNTLPISWTTVTPAGSYALEQQVNGGAWTTVYTGSTASYTTPALAAGTYNYRVTACAYYVCSPVPSATVAVNVVAPPTLTGGAWQAVYVGYPTNGAFTVNWTGGDLGVLLETQTAPYGQSGATNQTSYSISAGARSFSVAGKAPGVYYYSGFVGLCNNCALTNTIGVVVFYLTPQLTAPASNSGGNFTLSWTTVTPANGYWVEQQLNGGAWTTLYSGSANSYAVSGAASGSYNYRVHACFNSTCESVPSNTTTTVVYPATPALSVPLTNGTGTYSVTWSASASATYYQVDQSLNYGPWMTIYTASGTGTNLFGMADGFYQYQVRACSAVGCSTNSAIKSISVAQIPPTPTITTPSTNATGQFAPTWTATPVATTYQLDQRINGGSWVTVFIGNATAYPQMGLAAGTYDFQVRACNANGCSPSSAVATTAVTATNTVAGVSQTPVSYSNVVASLSQADINSSDQVGATPGSFTVDKTGAAKYSIPIVAVPGTAGATPKLSLDYSSEGGNGLFGVGWSLGGLSEITRCHQNKIQDGQNKPITWDSNDRYCMDGQRLIPVLYGVVYKKEIDDGDIIITYDANGNAATGTPEYFRVQHKDGSFSFYGNAPISRDPNGTSPLANSSVFDGKIIANNDASKVLTWRLRKHQDSVGNPIWYQYGWWSGHLIAEVRYAYGPNTGPDNYGARIYFTYTGRPDAFDIGYVGGLAGMGNSLRVSQITSENAGTTVRTYNLSYLEQPADAYTGPSHLSTVQECGLNNVCRTNPTTFTWQVPTPGFNNASVTAIPANLILSDVAFGDINGDGCMDGIFNNGRISYALGNCQNGTYSLGALGLFTDGTNFTTKNFEKGMVSVQDFNHDGHADVAVFENTTSGSNGLARYIYIYYSEPQSDGTWKLSSAPVSIYIAPKQDDSSLPSGFAWPTYVTTPFFTDLNGDGIIDIAFGSLVNGSNDQAYSGIGVFYGQKDSSQTASSSRPYNFGARQTLADAPGCNLPTNVRLAFVTPIGDMNGDGQVDLMINIQTKDSTVQNISAFETPTGSSTATSLSCWSTGNVGWTLGSFMGTDPIKVNGFDFNGDGLTDLGGNDGGSLNDLDATVQINSGTAVSAATQSTVANTKANVVGDLNGDGYVDVIWYNGSSNEIRLWNPTTQSYNTTPSATTSVPNLNNIAGKIVDINGDGILDVVFWSEGNSQLSAYLGAGPHQPNQSPLINQPGNVITKITNGLGAVTAINYENLTSQTATHYQKLNVNSSASTSYPGTLQWAAQPYVKSTSADFYTAMNQGTDPFTFQQSLGSNEAPISELTGPKWAVVAVDQSSPSTASNSTTLGGVNTAATRRTSYYYGEGKVENSIRGFLGFQTVKVVDETTGLQTITRYHQDFPFIGKPFAEDVYTSSNQLVSSSGMWWAFQNWGSTLSAPYLVTPEPAIVYKGMYNADVTGNPLLGSQTTTNTFDANLSKVTAQVDVKDASGNLVASTLTTNTYAADNRDYLGLPSQVTVQSSRPNQTTLTRTYGFTYCGFDATCPSSVLTGLLSQKIVEPNKSAYKVTTQYSYDGFGNPIQTVVSGTDIVNRTTSYAYDTRPGVTALGRFRDLTTNGLNQVVSAVAARNALGQPTQINGLNNTSVQYGYGPLGRQYLEYHNDGSYKTALRYTSFAGCAAGTQFADYTSASGGSSAVACYDVLGRPARTSSVSFASSSVSRVVDTEYDPAGRVHHVTEPYYSNASANGFTTTIYDDASAGVAAGVGRVWKVYAPDRALTMMTYSGLSTTTTYPSSQTKLEGKNLLGELSFVTDYLMGVVAYSYDAEGHPLTVTTSGPTQATGVPSFIIVSYAYDDVGRKKSMSDPDKGNWSYAYDVLGELVSQTDAKAQVISASYDALGRMLQRIDKKAGGAVEETTTWTYDTATNGVGQVASVQQATSGYARAHTYDWLGRENGQAISLTTEGIQYNVARYFDQYGREYQTFDASGNGVQRSFNAQGYFAQANDISSGLALGSELYAVVGMDAAGRVTSDRLGGFASGSTPLIGRSLGFDVLGRPTAVQSTSGITLQNLAYTYYPVGSTQYGNMQLRQDLAKGLTETFNYDGLNRLTSSQVTGQGAVTVSYDSFGNITTKSSQGAYGYANGAGPHAATTVGANTNTYDANGNYTGTTAGSTRTVTYNTFDKPLAMTSGSNSTTFTYGPDRDYYKRLDSDGTKTLYLLGVEKVYKPDGTRIDRRYLPGGAYQLKNYSSYTATTPTSTTVEYLLGDQQGSTDVIADANGNLKQAMSFDAWGMRRNPTTWVALTTAAGFDNSQTSHGYTGHEMVDNLDIIHMHGRIYDARWGRMLQADPYIVEAPSWMVGVQDLVNSQAQNRYAYVDNNPMMHVDPTGYEPCETADKCTAAQASEPKPEPEHKHKPEHKKQPHNGTQFMIAHSPGANGLEGYIVVGGGSHVGTTGGQSVKGATPTEHNNVGYNDAYASSLTPGVDDGVVARQAINSGIEKITNTINSTQLYGQLEVDGGKQVPDPEKFYDQVKTTIDRALGIPELKPKVQELIDAANKTIITYTQYGDYTRALGKDLLIVWNPYGGQTLGNGRVQSPDIGLIHEMGHAYDVNVLGVSLSASLTHANENHAILPRWEAPYGNHYRIPYLDNYKNSHFNTSATVGCETCTK